MMKQEVETPAEPGRMPPPDGRKVSPNVVQQGGEYSWHHEVNLWKDTLVPLTVLKIIVACSLAPAGLVLLLSILEGNAAEGLRVFGQIFGMVAGVMLGLFVIAYPIFILIKGGRYSLLFELDDKGVNHVEMPSTAERSALMAWVGFFAGAAAGNPTVMGANLLAGARRNMYSEFRRIRKVVLYRRRHALKLISSDMTRNLIYSAPEDFGVVEKLVLDRCPKDTLVVQK